MEARLPVSLSSRNQGGDQKKVFPPVHDARPPLNNKGGQDERSFMMKRGSATRLSVKIIEEEEDSWCKRRFRFDKMQRFNFIFFVIPTTISLLYAIAIMFPKGARDKASFFLWTDGALTVTEEGEYSICPRESICSEGGLQIFLIFISRTTAFASYIVMGATFLSKMHCFTTWLSFTHASIYIPFEMLHKIHKKSGTVYFLLALLHVIGHYIRWIIRKEVINRTNTPVGLSGSIGICLMIVVVMSMSSFAKQKATFETRLYAHYLMIVFIGALCFHTPRCRVMTLIFFGLWSLDSLYGYFFKTYRLDVVEFSPLPNQAGVQMLWRNPKGFRATSGMYVKIQFPWLSEGGNEWHAFSIYLREDTEQGLRSIIEEPGEEADDMLAAKEYLRIREVRHKKTALLLVEFQNEFASPGGRLHDDVKSELKRTGIVNNTVELAGIARAVGAHVFHIPIIHDGYGKDNPNQDLGVMKKVRDNKLFIENTWNADIIQDHRKYAKNDTFVKGKKGIDSFSGTNLQELLEEKGIETLIIGGLLTNSAVESTVRTAYDKGYNVITLTDGTACNSQAEQEAAVEHRFKMFSAPLTCKEAIYVLKGSTSLDSNRISSQEDDDLSLSLESEPEPESQGSIEEFAKSVLESQNKNSDENNGLSLTIKEARQDINQQYVTSQVFIAPVGDWTKRIAKEITDQDQLRSCWVRGPYASPYTIATNFNHLVLVASGIGITPALGVMGQFPGATRTKVVIWLTRSAEMLKFFAPLLKDAHMSFIFYTGKNYLFSETELAKIRSYGNIYIDQQRPKSLTSVIESIIVTYENRAKIPRFSIRKSSALDIINQATIDVLEEEKLKAWCVLYCGGSVKIQGDLREYAKKVGIGFDSEKFDW